ncbi:MFS transporter [Streptomyces shenzhenensis]|uniref:MFS transporter n=1 Tax=Streptomyces shenzhenensis TaxID=943815 RepID=UPI0033C27924
MAAAALVGSALEWYDFGLYGLAAGLVFNKVIFVNSDPTVATLLAFATFGVAYFIRPLGGLIFGRLGDIMGRRKILVVTLLVMGISTTLMAFVPTYAQAGIWSPVILVLLRVVQSIGAGAEFGGAAIMSVEHAAARRRGMWGSWPMVGIFLGSVMGSGAFALVASLPEEQFLSWGWRIPFAASALIIAFALWIRLRIPESPAFVEAKPDQQKRTVAPLSSAFRHEKKGMFVLFGTMVASNTVVYLNVFLPAYLTGTVNLAPSVAPTAGVVASAATIVTLPLFGALSDRIGRRPVVLGGVAFCALSIYPFFWIVDGTRSPLWITVALVAIFAIGVSAISGPQAAFFSELFTARARYASLAFSREVAGATAGGLTPLIAAALVAAGNGKPWLLSVYVVAACVFGGVVLALGPETRGRKLEALTIDELRGESRPAEHAARAKTTASGRAD